MSAGFQRFERARPDTRSAIRDRFPFEENLSLLPRRSASWKSLRASASISLVLHAVLLLALSMIFFNLPGKVVMDSILSLVVADDESTGDDLEQDLPVDMEAEAEEESSAGADQTADSAVELASLLPISLAPELNPNVSPNGSKPSVISKPPATIPKSATSRKEALLKGAKVDAADQHGDHFVGRSSTAKAALLKRMGGTDASEVAVARGLVWLKNHQLSDGSWSFDHVHSPQCDCTMAGRLGNNPNGATAMALLAFLGAGQTQEEGKYQSEVRRGLEFLMANGTPVGKGICFYGQLQGPPTFYTHGLVTIALSEAFAMTHDPDLRPPVAGAIEFLVATQHTQGGWRYFPGQPGDTSVVAWELMGLKSAQFSRITVPPRVFQGIDRFLGSVSSARGSRYAYMPERKNSPTPSMTAAGLLCRMYLDWNDTSVGLRSGVHFLDEHGPDPFDMYYNYYATQVLHHWGGEEWDRWNSVMREHLIKTQITGGHAFGSWDVSDRHGSMGGRLYMTTLALLTLEVYYRHLPLYQRDRIVIPLKVPEVEEAKVKPAK